MGLPRRAAPRHRRWVVRKRQARAGERTDFPAGRCSAMMLLAGEGEVHHAGTTLPAVAIRAGETLLLPAGLQRPWLSPATDCQWLEFLLPEQ